MQEVALFWIAYEITGSAMALGILGLSSAAPRLLFGALSGVFVDRYPRMYSFLVTGTRDTGGIVELDHDLSFERTGSATQTLAK